MRAVIPVKRVKDAKQRLASVLNASERRDLFVAMFEDVLDVITAVQDFQEVTVATVCPTAREIAERHGRAAYLIDCAQDIQSEWLSKVSTIGITAGASAPEALVADVIQSLEARGGELVNGQSTVDEGVSFTLPPELKDL